MAVEDIIKKIQETTEKKILEIEQFLNIEKSKILSDRDKKIEEIKQKIQSETEEKIQAEKNRLTAIANIELNKEILTEKKKLIKKVFDIAYKKILNLPANDYRNFIKQIILKNIQTGKEEIFLSEKDYREFGKELLKEITSKLTHTNNIKLNPSLITSGFVIKSNKKEFNATLEVIFEKYQEELEQEVSEILFKK